MRSSTRLRMIRWWRTAARSCERAPCWQTRRSTPYPSRSWTRLHDGVPRRTSGGRTRARSCHTRRATRDRNRIQVETSSRARGRSPCLRERRLPLLLRSSQRSIQTTNFRCGRAELCSGGRLQRRLLSELQRLPSPLLLRPALNHPSAHPRFRIHPDETERQGTASTGAARKSRPKHSERA